MIGAGLFVGSADAIATAGPGVLISYTFAGVLVVLVMRMLGEMAAATPDSGSFSTYADRAIGPWAGTSVGWSYRWFWLLVIPVEATATATILNSRLPAAPQWTRALVITVLLTVTNLFSVANYGEFEFWFALLKIVAIIGFIVIGVLTVPGLLPGSGVSGVSRLFDAGGFLPNGFGAVIAAVLTTMVSFMGTGIVTIAVAESDRPAEKIGRATRSVICGSRSPTSPGSCWSWRWCRGTTPSSPRTAPTSRRWTPSAFPARRASSTSSCSSPWRAASTRPSTRRRG
ncbi:MAG: hypothetical protein BGP03_32850 [Pseudonocardia sp. 73-21]|nr:amino acid permease [Pseudonocardia sp. 73-21]OJY47534.1 MAG: hypothetical protein BGP03_32850 [Pseudonocardia sp. 73-21]